MTHILSILEGPNVASVYLRAGWSLGQVQDRYIFYGAGADQYCGRIACGLNFHDANQFPALPPHFPNDLILTPDEWAAIIPNYSEYPQSFQTVLPYLVASIVNHYDWIEEKQNGEYINVNKNHPIHKSRIMVSGVIEKLRNKVIINVIGQCNITGMIATGIPTSITLRKSIEELKNQNALLIGRVNELEGNILDQLPDLVVNKIKDNINVDGLQQMTKDQLYTLLDTYYAKRQKIESTSDTTNGNVEMHQIPTTDNGDPYYSWGGKLYRTVPEGFVMPRGGAKQNIDLFISGIRNGDGNLIVRPLRRIDTKDLKRNCQGYYAKAAFVFNKVINEYRTLNNIEELDVDILSFVEWDNIWSEGFGRIIHTIGTKSRNPNELSYVTVYDKLAMK